MEILNIGRVEKMNEERKVQRAQYMRWWRWKEKEGVLHRPTRLSTYEEDCQKLRIKWLIENCFPFTDILEIGCSEGYILEKVKGKYGIDLNKKVIEENKIRNPKIKWIHHNAINTWPFEEESIDIVLLPDILEHNSYREAKEILKEAIRVAKLQILITIPNGLNPKTNKRNWACFKHKWVLTKERLKDLKDWLSLQSLIEKPIISWDNSFIYIKLKKRRKKEWRKKKGKK